jgi:hypothetical protein
VSSVSEKTSGYFDRSLFREWDHEQRWGRAERSPYAFLARAEQVSHGIHPWPTDRDLRNTDGVNALFHALHSQKVTFLLTDRETIRRIHTTATQASTVVSSYMDKTYEIKAIAGGLVYSPEQLTPRMLQRAIYRIGCGQGYTLGNIRMTEQQAAQLLRLHGEHCARILAPRADCHAVRKTINERTGATELPFETLLEWLDGPAPQYADELEHPGDWHGDAGLAYAADIADASAQAVGLPQWVITTRLRPAPDEPVCHFPAVTAGPEDHYQTFSARRQMPTIAMEVERTLHRAVGVPLEPGRMPGWCLCLHPRRDRLPGQSEMITCYDATILHNPAAFTARQSRFRDGDILDTQPEWDPQKKEEVQAPVRYASLALACGMAALHATARPELGPLRYIRLDGLIGCLTPRVIAIGQRFRK